jgi:uncharacterized repeat protein (TIGR03803 family)
LTLLIAGCAISNNPATPGVAAAVAAGATKSSSEVVLVRFRSRTYRADLASPLTPDGAGNYYGTTLDGGHGFGTLYELSPKGKGRWHESVLHTFEDYLDGGYPGVTPLILDRHGDVYGTAYNGGRNELGVAFRFHRTASGWVENVLHDFGNGDAYPFDSLIMGPGGNLYGTDNIYHDGGAITEGVYEIRPSRGAWEYKIIWDQGVDAANGGSGGLVLDARGNIFGVSSGFLEPAVVFELKPAKHGWSPVILYTFQDVGVYPDGAPVLDRAGNIYGTTAAGGSRKQGTIYKLSPSKGRPWKLKTLYGFNGGADGSEPFAGVTFDASGNIYGTTLKGGTSNFGTVYELTAGSHNEKLLWSFDGKDGSEPFAPVVLDRSGNLFGTTTSGGGGKHCYGAEGCGNAFEIAR